MHFEYHCSRYGESPDCFAAGSAPVLPAVMMMKLPVQVSVMVLLMTCEVMAQLMIVAATMLLTMRKIMALMKWMMTDRRYGAEAVSHSESD